MHFSEPGISTGSPAVTTQLTNVGGEGAELAFLLTLLYWLNF